MTLILRVLMIAMLGIALFPIQDYGYYILLKKVVFGGCCILAVQALCRGAAGWMLALGAVAVIYNPVVRFPLGREVWMVLNVATIVLLILSMKRKGGDADSGSES